MRCNDPSSLPTWKLELPSLPSRVGKLENCAHPFSQLLILRLPRINGIDPSMIQWLRLNHKLLFCEFSNPVHFQNIKVHALTSKSNGYRSFMCRSQERDLSSPYVCSSCLDYDLTVHNLPLLDPTIIVAPPPKILLLSVTWKDF